jgi:hypothetical protein
MFTTYIDAIFDNWRILEHETFEVSPSKQKLPNAKFAFTRFSPFSAGEVYNIFDLTYLEHYKVLLSNIYRI